MAKKAAKKVESDPAEPVVEKPKRAPRKKKDAKAVERPTYQSLDQYKLVHPDIEAFENKLGVEHYSQILFFPVDVVAQTTHFPGGYFFAGANNYEPGTFSDTSRPRYWVSIYDSVQMMRKWLHSEQEVNDTIEELIVLAPKNFRELEELGFVQES